MGWLILIIIFWKPIYITSKLGVTYFRAKIVDPVIKQELDDWFYHLGGLLKP